MINTDQNRLCPCDPYVLVTLDCVLELTTSAPLSRGTALVMWVQLGAQRSQRAFGELLGDQSSAGPAGSKQVEYGRRKRLVKSRPSITTLVPNISCT